MNDSSRARILRHLTLLALATFPSAAESQQAVRGAVRDGASGAPVEGAMVVLLDAADRTAGGVLTAADGGFRVLVPAPGLYRLRVDRIGYASTSVPAFDVPEGAVVERLIQTAVEAIQLGRLDVEGSRRCQVRPAEGLATARVWEEARKALAATAWTAERELYRFAWMRFAREIAPNGRRILNEERSYRRDFTRQVWVSLDPDTLARSGFLRSDGSQKTYIAPDANVLLSDAFLDTHCFALERRRDGDATLIGLRFEPIRGRRVPDVTGVLWLEEEGGRLRSLEYGYVNLGWRLDGEDAGGELTFRGLPNGTWIVQEWRIRMPRVAEIRNERGEVVRHRVLGYKDEGGVVNRVTTAAGEIVQDADDAGQVHGLVTDSLGRPAAGARVWIEGTPFAAVTDAKGIFAFSDLASGTWTVGGSHPALEGIGYTGTTQEVEIERGKAASIVIELPSMHRVALERCRETPATGSDAVVIGRVVDPDGAPVPEARVQVMWSAFDILSQGSSPANSANPGRVARTGDVVSFREDLAGIETLVSGDGVFVFCGVPTDHTVRLSASLGERSSEVTQLRLDRADDVVRAEIVLPPLPR